MLNCVTLQGRLTRDPDMRTTPSGVPVASFTIACERNHKNADGKRETDFIPCVAWRQCGEFIGKYFSKGDGITIEGSLQIREYTDKNGNKQRVAEIIVKNGYFPLTKKEQSTERSYAPPVEVEMTEVEDGDLPF